MSLSDEALIGLEEARRYVLRDAGDASHDGKLEDLINELSQAIHQYTRRQFLPKQPANDTGVGSDPVTLYFRYDGSGYLDFGHYELRPLNLGSIVLHSDLPASAQRILDPGDSETEAEYKLEPRNKTESGTWWAVNLPEVAIAESRRVKSIEVSVTGRWGAGTVPDVVKLALKKELKRHWENPSGMASRSIGALDIVEIAEEPEDVSASLSRGARNLLLPVKRPPYIP